MAQLAESHTALITGNAADPAIEILLPKEMLAQIKIRKIEMAINELQSNIKHLEMQLDMLQKEYKLR